jgi:Domain of unknown function (DUF4190)/zinc-ribbon domain
MKNCAKCGTENPEDAVFCAACGYGFQVQPDAGTLPPPDQAPPPPSTGAGAPPPSPPYAAGPPQPYGPPPPGYYPPGPPVAGGPYQYPVVPRSNGKATAALVLGIVGIFICPLICSGLALLFGYSARREIAASGGTLSGDSNALAGIILGWIGLVLAAIWVTIAIVVSVHNSSMGMLLLV